MYINIGDYPDAVEAIEDRRPAPGKERTRPTLARKRRERVKRTFQDRRKAWMGFEDRNPIKDREALSQIRTILAGMCKRTVKGRQWGVLTGKTEKIARALLDHFMDRKTGQCDPSYERIREVVGTCNQTIADALEALEKALILVVIHRVVRRRPPDGGEEVLVHRTSNAYLFRNPARGRAPVAVQAAREMTPLDRPQPSNYAALVAEATATQQGADDTSAFQRRSLSKKIIILPEPPLLPSLSTEAINIIKRDYRMA